MSRTQILPTSGRIRASALWSPQARATDHHQVPLDLGVAKQWTPSFIMDNLL